jgi:hypothetical protein
MRHYSALNAQSPGLRQSELISWFIENYSEGVENEEVSNYISGSHLLRI